MRFLVKEVFKVFFEFGKYIDESGRFDFLNREVRIFYNRVIVRVIFGLDVEYYFKGFVIILILCYFFLKIFFRGGEKVFEIGIGYMVMMVFMVERFFNCDVIVIEFDEEFFEYVKRNIEKNGVNVKFIKSNGGIIRGVVFKGERFDVIFFVLFYYEVFMRGVLMEKEGVGGGRYGEVFFVRFIEEVFEYFNLGGKVVLFFLDKELLIEVIVEKGKEFGYFVRDVKFKVGMRWRYSFLLYKF